jgi:hypothetical protein
MGVIPVGENLVGRHGRTPAHFSFAAGSLIGHPGVLKSSSRKRRPPFQYETDHLSSHILSQEGCPGQPQHIRNDGVRYIWLTRISWNPPGAGAHANNVALFSRSHEQKITPT